MLRLLRFLTFISKVVFPAAILQFPMFDVNSDAAVNFGAMGAVIAHEMTHGFDDQGRKFDKGMRCDSRLPFVIIILGIHHYAVSLFRRW